ncbi:glycosyltransferase family 4 protein [Amycolatopsis panacis]|uniref:Glycosyltransferase n=1 Tax=Amycolatopsis panacis TaxID=2340917 RepID=A0A419I3B3_9PSEU|nr:glycosyltransferase family 4 protein [Amycolatopsis panacis]RJQ84567.1 glycosyltransferase [Amycolatopsis panacis]
MGFACAWDDPPQPTWSHTPWQLRAALREQTTVTDLGLDWPRPARLALKALAARRHEGRWVSGWKHHRLTQALVQQRLRRAETPAGCDVVLQIGDLARLRGPYLVYQDLSFDLLREERQLRHFPHLSATRIEQLAERQREIYAGAAGVLAMSEWLAGHLVRVTGLPADKVHVVNPGCNVLPAGEPQARPAGGRQRLLFVGKDFTTKAGPQVVAAWEILRRDGHAELELTIAGPAQWPMPGPIPHGVRFLGRIPLDQVRELYATHDLFVLPSHFEGYGIAFTEALAHGLPCVGRDRCAMPEIIRPGENGGLVTSEDPAELASLIAELLADEELRERTVRQAPAVIEHAGWSRAATEVLTVAAKLS